MSTKTASPLFVLGGLAVWFAAAWVAGATGAISRLNPPLPQVLIFGLAAAALAAVRFVPALRAWAMTVDPRWFVAVHLGRFVGFYFFVLYGRGELPYAFAVPGGAGDVLVAFVALVLIGWGTPWAESRRRAYLVWNALGLADILFVIVTAARLTLHDRSSMAALFRLPLAAVLTFLVPLILATHVLVFVRLRAIRD